MQLTFTAPLWRWTARQDDAWWFVTVPPDESDLLAELPLPPRGFGSIRVEVTVGSTTWRTSVFPSDEHKAYVLPMKKQVRTAEHLEPDQPVPVRLVTVDL
ncbi:DUF1905 domain-containing protein [Isoptericola dokdonensis]|uniref:DUF1905 domain-containing protein n=1 Tax=Isoptericola dokdonensis DS-3 TaxID=1300344 RepID=A0A161IKT0_9MICO|nr:DUF1905 domain-containing protein [Isoptericola dokdonensis]ANC30990.1 hypothetical protein I598_1434 [Isoptericola dokdonensis DS-3]